MFAVYLFLACKVTLLIYVNLRCLLNHGLKNVVKNTSLTANMAHRQTLLHKVTDLEHRKFKKQFNLAALKLNLNAFENLHFSKRNVNHLIVGNRCLEKIYLLKIM